MHEEIDDLLIQTIEKVAKLEGFPPDWKDWAYWEEEKRRRFSGFPAPWDLTGYIEEIKDGRPGTRGDVIDLFLEKAFLSPQHTDVRKHPLWKSILRIAGHPDLEDSHRKEFFYYCSEEDLYLRTFTVDYYLLEKPDGGKVVNVEVFVPANTEEEALDRAEGLMQRECNRLVEEFGLQPPYFHDVMDTRGGEWLSEPKENMPPQIHSADRVE